MTFSGSNGQSLLLRIASCNVVFVILFQYARLQIAFNNSIVEKLTLEVVQ